MSIALIHTLARRLAITGGCERFGYGSGLLVMDRPELIARLRRYSGASEESVSQIVTLITFGSSGIQWPDPALQPLILLHGATLAISPALILGSSLERNLIVLINKIPAKRAAYLQVVNQKESRMKESIVEDMSCLSLRLVPGLSAVDKSAPDVDLVIISDSERMALILELKWFVEPAEVREVIEKTEEVEKGIQQLELIKSGVSKESHRLCGRLGIDLSFTVRFAVVTEGFIGLARIHKREFPVISRRHLVSAMKELKSLRAVGDWMDGGGHLPVLGRHFEICDQVATVGKWSLKWYQFRSLAPFTTSPAAS